MYSLILHGKRLVDLQKCRNFRRIPLKLLQNASSFSNPFSSSASAAADLSPRDGRNGDIFTSYLVDSLGLTTKLADSISRKVSSEAKGDPVSVLNLLRSYGFTESQMRDIITDYPQLLIADAEKSVAPKLKFLQSRVASSSELTEILSKVPKILGKKGEKTIAVYYDFVKEIIEADKSSKFEKLCLSLPQGKQENKLRNISLLREVGVPQKVLLSLLISDVGPVCGKDKFQESLKMVVDMGFDPTTPRFVIALRVLYRTSDKGREEKINLYERLGFDVWAIFKKWPSILIFSVKNILNSIETFVGLGFTRDEFVMMVKRLPPCIGLSAETMKKKTEFLVKMMNWPIKVVASHPQVLGYSMEKRIVPRCNVIKSLMSRGLLGNGSELPSLSCVLSTTDETFLNMYVRKHHKMVPELMDIFMGGRVS